MRLRASFVVAFLIAGGIDAATTLDDLERAVHEVVREREKLAHDRRARGVEAAALADEISQLKQRESTPRANRELERRLRAFDRLANALDDLDRRIKTQDRMIDQARRRFEKQADSELARMARKGRGGASLASRVEIVEAAMRRVRRSTVRERVVRPALEIALEPNDGPAEIRLKLALLKAERRRIAGLIDDLDQEIRVVETRLAIKRQLAREMEAVSVEAGLGLSLLQRETDDLLQAVRELEQRRKKLMRDRDRLPQVLLQLDERAESLIAKERELITTKKTPEEP